ncbi:hypothetical protein EXIGLDRAFT_783436 [Exidia glandulosa HHB12029]|uniref:Uncharacterized protein n=1 Tax=Exidia glandulosa HHB12029 TaxID=1314781 RepID=A0A165Z1Y9_EXIGL|nr:hypothetical protein EXIGLDRAFT_783436 [Exidia glandulosa HHB12029]
MSDEVAWAPPCTRALRLRLSSPYAPTAQLPELARVAGAHTNAPAAQLPELARVAGGHASADVTLPEPHRSAPPSAAGPSQDPDPRLPAPLDNLHGAMEMDAYGPPLCNVQRGGIYFRDMDGNCWFSPNARVPAVYLSSIGGQSLTESAERSLFHDWAWEPTHFDGQHRWRMFIPSVIQRHAQHDCSHRYDDYPLFTWRDTTHMVQDNHGRVRLHRRIVMFMENADQLVEDISNALGVPITTRVPFRSLDLTRSESSSYELRPLFYSWARIHLSARGVLNQGLVAVLNRDILRDRFPHLVRRMRQIEWYGHGFLGTAVADGFAQSANVRWYIENDVPVYFPWPLSGPPRPLSRENAYLAPSPQQFAALQREVADLEASAARTAIKRGRRQRQAANNRAQGKPSKGARRRANRNARKKRFEDNWRERYGTTPPPYNSEDDDESDSEDDYPAFSLAPEAASDTRAAGPSGSGRRDRNQDDAGPPGHVSGQTPTTSHVRDSPSRAQTQNQSRRNDSPSRMRTNHQPARRGSPSRDVSRRAIDPMRGVEATRSLNETQPPRWPAAGQQQRRPRSPIRGNSPSRPPPWRSARHWSPPRRPRGGSQSRGAHRPPRGRTPPPPQSETTGSGWDQADFAVGWNTGGWGSETRSAFEWGTPGWGAPAGDWSAPAPAEPALPAPRQEPVLGVPPYTVEDFGPPLPPMVPAQPEDGWRPRTPPGDPPPPVFQNAASPAPPTVDFVAISLSSRLGPVPDEPPPVYTRHERPPAPARRPVPDDEVALVRRTVQHLQSAQGPPRPRERRLRDNMRDHPPRAPTGRQPAPAPARSLRERITLGDELRDMAEESINAALDRRPMEGELEPRTTIAIRRALGLPESQFLREDASAPGPSTPRRVQPQRESRSPPARRTLLERMSGPSAPNHRRLLDRITDVREDDAMDVDEPAQRRSAARDEPEPPVTDEMAHPVLIRMSPRHFAGAVTEDEMAARLASADEWHFHRPDVHEPRADEILRQAADARGSLPEGIAQLRAAVEHGVEVRTITHDTGTRQVIGGQHEPIFAYIDPDAPRHEQLSQWFSNVETLMRRPYARAALLRGGLAWRIARSFIGQREALDGPSLGAFDLGAPIYRIEDESWLDDWLTPEEESVLIGRIHGTEYTMLPPLAHFALARPPWDGVWTDEDEGWFMDQLRYFLDGAPLYTRAQWRHRMRAPLASRRHRGRGLPVEEVPSSYKKGKGKGKGKAKEDNNDAE